MILKNEILLIDDEEIIYKTISDDYVLFGMFSSKRGVIVEPSFLHIFKFEGKNAVVIDQRESYWWIDYNAILDSLNPETEALYKKYIIKNSLCNCYNIDKLRKHCTICGGMGQIVNKYSGRQLDGAFE